MGKSIRASNKSRQGRKKESKSTASRAIWKGSIDFGLVSIPVRLYAAEASDGLSFDLLDKRDFSHVRYRRVNEKTGKEVPWDDIIKGYEYKKGEYVALSDADFAHANVEATQTISITDFVDASAVTRGAISFIERLTGGDLSLIAGIRANSRLPGAAGESSE